MGAGRWGVVGVGQRRVCNLKQGGSALRNAFIPSLFPSLSLHLQQFVVGHGAALLQQLQAALLQHPVRVLLAAG